jgi:quinolinate synthase
VNCSAEVKALSDILCTSSNAVKIIESIPKEQPILFAPDQHLGRYLIKKTGRDMLLWNGACIVHETFDAKKIIELKARHPGALVIAHPECRETVLALADHIGSTASLLKFSKDSDAQAFIVVTEAGILHQMQKASPEKTFIAAPNSEACLCAECPFMRLNSLEKIRRALESGAPEISVPEEIRTRALVPLQRMLDLS